MSSSDSQEDSLPVPPPRHKRKAKKTKKSRATTDDNTDTTTSNTNDRETVVATSTTASNNSSPINNISSNGKETRLKSKDAKKGDLAWFSTSDRFGIPLVPTISGNEFLFLFDFDFVGGRYIFKKILTKYIHKLYFLKSIMNLGLKLLLHGLLYYYLKIK